MKVFIGADHRGFELKNKLIDWLKSNDYEAQDCGAHEYEQIDDYPDFAKAVAERTANEERSRGIVICGSGAGVDITANKIKGVRSTIGFNIEQVRAALNDDNINVLALASDFTDEQAAIGIVKTFLETEFDPSEKHARRIEKINALEN